jgi:hypothetical protein
VAGFGLDQVWAQLAHHTERANQQAIGQLGALVGSEEFLRGLDQVEQATEGEEEDEYEVDEEQGEEELDESAEEEVEEDHFEEDEDIERYLDD